MKVVFLLLLAFCAFAFAQESNALPDISGLYADDKDSWSFHLRQVNDLVWMSADPVSSGGNASASGNNTASDKRFVFFGHANNGKIGLGDMSNSSNASDFKALIVGSWAFVPVSEGQNLAAADWGLLTLGLANNDELRVISETNFKDAFQDVMIIRKAGGGNSTMSG